MSPSWQESSGRVIPLLALVLLVDLPMRRGVVAQSQDGAGLSRTDLEARPLDPEEVGFLRDWAERRLEALDPRGLEEAPEELDRLQLERLWAMYFLSLEERSWEEEALALGDSLSGVGLGIPFQSRALRAAIEVVRAKNSRWPPNKLKHLRIGLEALDRMVEESPENPAVRYLRLVSCYYLPFFIDRDESVEADFQALFRILPRGGGEFPPLVFQAVLAFVLEKGDPTAEERVLLEGMRVEGAPL